MMSWNVLAAWNYSLPNTEAMTQCSDTDKPAQMSPGPSYREDKTWFPYYEMKLPDLSGTLMSYKLACGVTSLAMQTRRSLRWRRC